MPNYYVDLNRSGVVGDGTSDNPWGFSEFYSNIPTGGPTYKFYIRGDYEDKDFIFAKNTKEVTLIAWDSTPWTLSVKSLSLNEGTIISGIIYLQDSSPYIANMDNSYLYCIDSSQAYLNTTISGAYITRSTIASNGTFSIALNDPNVLISGTILQCFEPSPGPGGSDAQTWSTYDYTQNFVDCVTPYTTGELAIAIGSDPTFNFTNIIENATLTNTGVPEFGELDLQQYNMYSGPYGPDWANYSTGFDATPTQGVIPLTVNFSGYTNISDPTYSWDFGNLTYSGGQVVNNIYSTPNSYTVTMSVSGINPKASDLYLGSYLISDMGYANGYYSVDPYLADELLENVEFETTDSGFVINRGGDSQTTILEDPYFLIGDFDIQFDFAMVQNTDNISQRFYLHESGVSEATDIFYLYYHNSIGYDGVSEPKATDDGAISGRLYTMRILRGAILLPDGTVSGYTTSPEIYNIHSYFLDNWSGGATNEWIEFTSSETSTPQSSLPIWITWNTATHHGLTNFYFQSEDGLPYATTVGYSAAEFEALITALGNGTEIRYINLTYHNPDRSNYTTIIDRMKFTDCAYEG